MTVKEAKAQIVKAIEELDLDGIHITGIGVHWQATTDLEGAKPTGKVKCYIELEAQL